MRLEIDYKDFEKHLSEIHKNGTLMTYAVRIFN